MSLTQPATFLTQQEYTFLHFIHFLMFHEYIRMGVSTVSHSVPAFYTFSQTLMRVQILTLKTGILAEKQGLTERQMRNLCVHGHLSLSQFVQIKLSSSVSRNLSGSGEVFKCPRTLLTPRHRPPGNRPTANGILPMATRTFLSSLPADLPSSHAVPRAVPGLRPRGVKADSVLMAHSLQLQETGMEGTRM